MIAEGRNSDGIEMALLGATVIEIMIDRVVSSENLKGLIPKFVGRKVKSAVKDITVENAENVWNRPSSLFSGPQAMYHWIRTPSKTSCQRGHEEYIRDRRMDARPWKKAGRIATIRWFFDIEK